MVTSVKKSFIIPKDQEYKSLDKFAKLCEIEEKMISMDLSDEVLDDSIQEEIPEQRRRSAVF